MLPLAILDLMVFLESNAQGDLVLIKVYPSLNVNYHKSTEYFRERQISGKRLECPLSLVSSLRHSYG
jgi:hypothetical protein